MTKKSKVSPMGRNRGAKDEITPRCEYCQHNQGENKQFGYMWHCEELNHCVCFGRNYCQAKKLGKGDFKIDTAKFQAWTKEQQEAA